MTHAKNLNISGMDILLIKRVLFSSLRLSISLYQMSVYMMIDVSVI